MSDPALSDAQTEMKRRWFDRQHDVGADPDEADLKGGEGGGTSTPVTKDENLKGRVDLLQALVMVFIAGLMALAVGVLASFNGVNTRLDGVQTAASSVNREVGEVSVKADETNRRLERMETKIDQIADRLPRK